MPSTSFIALFFRKISVSFFDKIQRDFFSAVSQVFSHANGHDGMNNFLRQLPSVIADVQDQAGLCPGPATRLEGTLLRQ